MFLSGIGKLPSLVQFFRILPSASSVFYLRFFHFFSVSSENTICCTLFAELHPLWMDPAHRLHIFLVRLPGLPVHRVRKCTGNPGLTVYRSSGRLPGFRTGGVPGLHAGWLPRKLPAAGNSGGLGIGDFLRPSTCRKIGSWSRSRS